MLFVIPPLVTHLNLKIQSGVERVEINGGSSRYRQDQVGLVNCSINVTWVVDQEGYDYIRGMYRLITENGSLPFDIYLSTLTMAKKLHTNVYFLPGSLKWTSKNNTIFTVTAQLVITPTRT
jgi:hypothetical protein